jgi:ubiquinol-cytochrome c reductase cytochrome b subunit
MSTTDPQANATRSAGFLRWLADRTGLPGSLRECPVRGTAGRPGWWSLWISLILGAAVIQAITGWVLWMYYSPSAQTAWESVYFIQYEVLGGWLLRGLHYWTAQVLVALLLLYVVQMIVRGVYRAPREFVFWTALGMAVFALALCLTGDLLSWDQNGYASTQTRVSFLNLLPWIGGALFRLAAGGPAFGHLTLTRFFALHVGCFAGLLFAFFLAHLWLVRRAALAPAAGGNGKPAADSSARGRSLAHPSVHSAACLGLLAVVLLFVFSGPLAGRSGSHPGDYFGKELGAPADRDPANFYKAARPEWTFRGLYGFSNAFPGELKILPIFVFTTIFALLVVAMPVIAYCRWGHALNLFVFAVLAAGLIGFSYASWAHDWGDEDYRAALQAGEEEAQRVKELIRGLNGIPPTGALTLLRNDPKTQGPKIWKQQCAVCHDCTDPEGIVEPTENPTAPDLAGFGSRDWIAGLFDPEKVKGPNYFGNTRFAAGAMVRCVEGRLAKLKPGDRKAVIEALAAEAQPGSPPAEDAGAAAQIEKGRQLIAGDLCARCHRFHEAGKAGFAPDLTGYASREWTVGILADPRHSSFYGLRNDRMPAYVEMPARPEKNRLQPEQIGLVADWLRGQWYRPEGNKGCGCLGPAEGEKEEPVEPPVLLTLGVWEARRMKQETPPAKNPAAEALALYQQEHCALCHPHTGTPQANIVPEHPCAPDLGGFASREWLTGLLDPKRVDGPKYFGNSALKKGEMVAFVKGNLREALRDMGKEGQESLAKMIAALAAEAQRDAPAVASGPVAGKEALTVFEDLGCVDCHKFYDKGKLGTGPNLTGYGSRDWLVGIITDPTGARFYRNINDGMPSYRMFPKEAGRNLLDGRQIERMADWLRGK